MIDISVLLDRLENAACIFHYELFESISLVEEGKHVLLHSLSWYLFNVALLIILPLRIYDIDYELSCLLK